VGCDGFFVGFWFHGDWMDGGGGGGGEEESLPR
jgi:hypothetical protein